MPVGSFRGEAAPWRVAVGEGLAGVDDPGAQPVSSTAETKAATHQRFIVFPNYASRIIGTATMTTGLDRLANVLGATAITLGDRIFGEDGVATLPPPADHPSAAATLALLNWVPRIPQGRLAYCLGLSQPATVRL